MQIYRYKNTKTEIKTVFDMSWDPSSFHFSTRQVSLRRGVFSLLSALDKSTSWKHYRANPLHILNFWIHIIFTNKLWNFNQIMKTKSAKSFPSKVFSAKGTHSLKLCLYQSIFLANMLYKDWISLNHKKMQNKDWLK